MSNSSFIIRHSSFKHPFWLKMFFVLLAILPFSMALSPTATIDLSLVRVFISLLFLLWLFWSLANKKIAIDRRARFWLLVFFLLLSVLSSFWATDSFRAGRKIFFLLSIFPIYFVAFSATFQKKNIFFIIKIFLWSSFILACFGIVLFSIQFIWGLDPTLKLISTSLSPLFLGQAFSQTVLSFPSWLVNISGVTVLRAFGSFPDPHLFALYLNLLLPLFGFLAYKEKVPNKKRFYVLIIAIILLSSLLSFSRAAYFSLIGGLIFWFLASNPIKVIKKYPLFFSLTAIIIVLGLIIPNPLTSRFFSSFSLQEGSNQGRIIMWEKSLEIIEENPLGGVGIGNFSRYLEPRSTYRDPIYAHNLFLDFGSETGILNILLLLGIVFSPIYAYFKEPTALKKALAVSFVIFIIHSMFETPFYSVRVFPLFLILLAFQTDGS